MCNTILKHACLGACRRSPGVGHRVQFEVTSGLLNETSSWSNVQGKPGREADVC